MSDAKTGTVAISPLIVSLPVLAAGALAIGAIGGTAFLLSHAARGMFRLGKETYDSIDQAIEESIATDLENRMAGLKKLLAEQTDERSHENFDIERWEKQEEEQDKKNYDVLIQAMTALAEKREAVEKEKKLRKDVSQEFRKALEEYKKNRPTTRSRDSQPKKTKSLETMARKLNDVKIKIAHLKLFFPEFAKVKTSALKNMEINDRSLNRLSEELDEKLSLIKGDRGQWYQKLSSKFTKIQTSPFYSELDETEKEDISLIYEKSIGQMKRVENGKEFEACIQNFEVEAVKPFREKVEKREMDRRYGENLDLLKQSMKKSGYEEVAAKREAETVELTYKEKSGKTVHFKIKKAEIENKDLPDFRMEVAPEGFGSIKERSEEGKRLMYEMESMGLQIDYVDMSGPVINEKNKASVIEAIRKELKKNHIHNVNITWEINAEVAIGDQRFNNELSILGMVENYLQKTTKPSQPNLQPLDQKRQRESI